MDDDYAILAVLRMMIDVTASKSILFTKIQYSLLLTTSQVRDYSANSRNIAFPTTKGSLYRVSVNLVRYTSKCWLEELESMV